MYCRRDLVSAAEVWAGAKVLHCLFQQKSDQKEEIPMTNKINTVVHWYPETNGKLQVLDVLGDEYLATNNSSSQDNYLE